MKNFHTEIHGPDEEVGLFDAEVWSDSYYEEGVSPQVTLKVVVYKKGMEANKEFATLAIKYNLNTKEYEPLLGAETSALYGSVIIMLEETLGTSWGYEVS